ncbi:LytR C-terminal domain-containing protein [candidate division WOR-3 bacterium]|nr:LytR C-terminal domain-containing protein [candidate division WOR-3 bacterium]
MKKRTLKRKSSNRNKNSNLFVRITIFILTFLLLSILASMILRFAKKEKRLPYNVSVEYPRVEVLNGCGVDNLAYKVSMFLREKGFDVVEISNVKESNVERTIIIERVDKNMKNAKILRKIVNCPNMTTMIDSTLFLEVTLLLGKDYKKYFTKRVLERKIY